MANGTKRGPGRPPGSKNKKKKDDKISYDKSASPKTKQEQIDQMYLKLDKDRRTVDVIWGITLIAIAVFLFFTVSLDTTGILGKSVHNFCLGMFGAMAYVLPFMILIFALLLIARKLQHISARTSIFGFLIFMNICILNSYRFIDEKNLAYSFRDIGIYYRLGVRGEQGGTLGMELGSLLVKFFGKPGLIIFSLAVLLISVFLVANTPISRFFERAAEKRENRRILKELDEKEKEKIQMSVAATATPGADPDTGVITKGYRSVDMQDTIVQPLVKSGENKSKFWTGLFQWDKNKGDKAKELPDRKEINYTFRDEDKAFDDEYYFNANNLNKSAEQEKRENSIMELMKRATLFGRRTSSSPAKEIEEENYGYPKERRKKESLSERATEAVSTKSPTNAKTYGLAGYLDDKALSTSKSYGLGGKRATRNDDSANAVRDISNTTLEENKPFENSINNKYSSKDNNGNTQVNRDSNDNNSINDNKINAHTEKAKEKSDEISADEIQLTDGFNSNVIDESYRLPDISLLKKSSSGKQIMSDVQKEAKAELLERTLNNFGVEAKVLTVTQGASVTRYEIQPATGVKVSSITRLADDIALNLRAKSIRIEAPIPGKAAVGIEVENDKPSPVLVRDLIESDEFQQASSKIEFVVGKDISGKNIVADLKDMPHMLIAGATGSGKSVCINTIITSFLYKSKPSELKLIMIDPKIVELASYNGIPHMLTPVVTDPRKASRALAIAVEEMNKRYELFAKEGVKDLESYNELMIANHERQNCKPKVVIIIDELADLMMAAPSEVETSICRLAQKARAAGMHLIVATQRPSVDVVTGLIKANIPSRIAFSVASSYDSKTILDMSGAEKLLGKGDMLFSATGSSKPIRVQGPFISDVETERIIKFVKKEGGGPVYDEELKNAIESDEKKSKSEPQDELTSDAVAFILKSNQASVSMLQRRFRIGYNRAARIIDEIEEMGIIGPSDGSRPRQVLVTEDEYYGRNTEDFNDNEKDKTESFLSNQKKDEPEEIEQNRDHEYDENSVNSDIHQEEYDNAEKQETQANQETQEVQESQEDQVIQKSENRGIDAFNSLPKSVQRMIMDVDAEQIDDGDFN